MSQLFNCAEYLLDRRLAAGDGARVALAGPAGELSYAQLHDRSAALRPGCARSGCSRSSGC